MQLVQSKKEKKKRRKKKRKKRKERRKRKKKKKPRWMCYSLSFANAWDKKSYTLRATMSECFNTNACFTPSSAISKLPKGNIINNHFGKSLERKK
jgi:sRNA-binding protein